MNSAGWIHVHFGWPRYHIYCKYELILDRGESTHAGTDQTPHIGGGAGGHQIKRRSFIRVTRVSEIRFSETVYGKGKGFPLQA
jgi:hypothetical protein